MSIEFSWYLDDHIILARISSKVTADDLRIGNETVTAWMNQSSASIVHVMFDTTAMEGVGFSVSQSLNTLKYLNHVKMSGFVVYGLPGSYIKIVNFMGTIITQLTRARFRTCKTLDECLQYLKMIDPTLEHAMANMPVKQ